MKVRILTARSHARRLDAAREWLGARPRLESILLLADRRRVADELVRHLAAEGQGRLGVRTTTPRLLAAEVARLAEGVVPVSGLGAEAVVARAVDRTRRDEGPLEFFEPVWELPGFQPALVATLSDLRLARVPEGALVELGPRGRDLSRLLRAYEAELRRLGLADSASLFEVGAEGFQAPGGDGWTSLLCLDPQVGSRLEAEWFARLVASVERAEILLPSADTESRAFLEEVLPTGAEALDEDEPTDRLGRGRRFLFEREIPELESASPDRSLVFFSAPGEGQEAVEIARRIHALGRDGVGFDRVAVLLRNPAVYQPLIEAALDRAGIPAYYSRGVRRPDPAGRALLALLDCVTEGLSARRFAEYLAFGQVPTPTESGEPPEPEVPWLDVDEEGREPEEAEETDEGPQMRLDFGAVEPPVVAGTLAAPHRWEELLVEAAVVEGVDRWRRRLGGLEAELRRQLRDPENDGEARRRIERSLDRLQHLERFALPLVEELAEWPTSGTWREWLQRLERLAVRSLRRPARVLRVLAELRPMAEVEAVSRAEVRRVLGERLTDLRDGTEGRRYGQVFVGPIDEARGRSFDTVFLPGLAEGIFPRPHFEDPLLLDTDRRRLESGLATRETLGSRERLLAGLAVGAAGERLVASYPTLDSIQERARVPSFYALDLLRAADGTLPDQRTLEREAGESSALRQGWPAPRDPERAIDAAEFDLAVVEPLLRGLESGAERSELRGRASYLLAVSDRLARSLRMRGRRWRNFFSSADGLVDPGEELAPTLAARRLGAKAHSPTALQAWAACPYRFYLRGVAGLRPRDETVRLERLDPRTRGSLFHEMQAETLRELRRRESLPVRPERLEVAFEALDLCFERIARESEEELVPALEGVWRSELEALRVDLRGWLRQVAEEEGDWLPIHFELGFGLPRRDDRDPASVVDPVTVLERFQVRGAIDLVELDEARGRLRVTDHKTGRAPQAEVIAVGGGEILQPLLYALAAQEVLERPAESGRLFYSTRRGKYETRETPISPYHLQYLTETLEAIDEGVATGFLPAAPNDGACRYCDFRPVCGPYEELRVQRKRRSGKTKERLARLDLVRSYQ